MDRGRQENSLAKVWRDLPSLLLQQVVYSGLRLLILLLSWTALPVNHFYGACIGRMLWWFDGHTKRISRVNLKIAFPDRSQAEREQLLKSNLIELGKTVTELGPVWNGSPRRIRRLVADVRGAHHVENALAAGRGVIMLSPHIGAWELMGLYLSLEYGITSLYRPPKLTSAERFSREVRERFGANLVPTDVKGVGALRRALSRNEMIGILPDQDPGESGGYFAPFFGRSARTMLLVSRLAAKADCPVVISFAERLPWGRGYRIHFIPADPCIASQDPDVAAAALNADVELVIRLNPAQYQWSYKRYKSVPAGEVCPYSQGWQLDQSPPSEEPLRRAA